MSDTEQKLPIRCQFHGRPVDRWREEDGLAVLRCDACGSHWTADDRWQPLNDDFGLPVPPTLEELNEKILRRMERLVLTQGESQAIGWWGITDDLVRERMTHPDWKAE